MGLRDLLDLLVPKVPKVRREIKAYRVPQVPTDRKDRREFRVWLETSVGWVRRVRKACKESKGFPDPIRTLRIQAYIGRELRRVRSRRRWIGWRLRCTCFVAEQSPEDRQ